MELVKNNNQFFFPKVNVVIFFFQLLSTYSTWHRGRYSEVSSAASFLKSLKV